MMATDRLIIRCQRTGNHVGTDTWKDGYPCPCDNCTKYLIQIQKPLDEDAVRVLRENLKDLYL